ncbi:diguanylate cyclase domain-containing protein [Tropicimonas sp. S265A]|uniref:diguanylate cyclase domain-containing protein n=1 Tax=Tropicimonas sp. S265A TaxID=3415134 RepID=UPI003C7B64FE
MSAKAENTRVLGLSARTLDALMPMHLWVGPSGHLLHAGRTLKKVLGAENVDGKLLFDVLQFKRPRKLKSLDQVLRLNTTRVQATLKDIDGVSLRGVVVALPGGAGAFINLSFGISVHDAVRRFKLDISDFAAADLAVEMLYLIEANAAVMAESQSLNLKLQASKRDAEQRALTDTLTGLNNRRAMDVALEQMVAQPGPQGFGLMHVDLDYFKSVNDTLGHAAGDHVLLRVADVLQSETRSQDVVCRVGGDEFVLLLRDCNDKALLARIAERIIARLEEPIMFEGQVARISASIGITLSSFYDAPEGDKILSDADEATYASKHGGRAQHTFFVPDPVATGSQAAHSG